MRVPPDARIQQHGTAAARAYARSLRRPKSNTWYGDYDPRSWRVAATQIREQHLGIDDVRRAGSILRSARSSGRYLCALPRSGTNWLFAMINGAMSLHHGGDGTFELVPDRTPAGDDEWVFAGPRYGWPALPRGFAMALAKDADRPVGETVFLYGHEPLPQGLLDYRRSRPVVSVRDPFAAASSLVLKDGLEWTLAEPGRLEAAADRVERFFSVWEQRLADPATAERSVVLVYEQLREDPLAGLLAVNRLWALGIDQRTWEDAIERCSWRSMEQVVGERRDTMRISLGAVDLPAEVEGYLRERCDRIGARLLQRTAR
ncbi:MAG TPA: hypothetical protein VNS19_23155 [Acidimicrobiales bacterium]|nr:hypothetical protein [Acidimicrobiales bacterium]